MNLLSVCVCVVEREETREQSRIEYIVLSPRSSIFFSRYSDARAAGRILGCVVWLLYILRKVAKISSMCSTLHRGVVSISLSSDQSSKPWHSANSRLPQCTATRITTRRNYTPAKKEHDYNYKRTVYLAVEIVRTLTWDYFSSSRVTEDFLFWFSSAFQRRMDFFHSEFDE